MTKPSYKQKLNEIEAVFLDVDGVITDGQLIMHPSGEFLRNMSTRDGYAMKKTAFLLSTFIFVTMTFAS